MDNLKQKSVILEENNIGNFKIGVGDENSCYTRKWNFTNNNFLHCEINKIGDVLYCISLNDYCDITEINLYAKFLYDCDFICQIKTFIENIDLYVFSCDDNNNCIWESYENKIEDKIEKNKFLKFEITTKNIKKGDCLFTIDFHCTTKQTKQTKIPLQEFMKNIYSTNNYNHQ
jgi:hypothetical protein